jgi:hypothetical protein
MNTRTVLFAALCAMVFCSCGQKGHMIGESAKTNVIIDKVLNLPLKIKKGDTLSVCLRTDINDGQKAWYVNNDGYRKGDTIRANYQVDVVEETKLFIAE